MQATLSGCLKCCGAIRVLGNNVSALIHQHLGGVSLLGRIKPGIHPDHLDLDVRVDRMGAEQKGINAADDFGNRERGDITNRVGFRDLARNHALHIAAFVETRDVGRDIIRVLVPCGMLELYVREAFGHFERGLHVAERGCEDKFVSSLGEFCNRTFGVWSLRYVLHKGGLDVVTEFFL